MSKNPWPILLTLALASLVACPAFSQEDDRGNIRQGGAVIIIQDGRVVLEEQFGDAAVDPLPTAQQLQAVIISQNVRDLVGQLDAPEFVAREQATRRLIDLRVDDVQLFAVFERGNLTAEQRHRLLYVVRERLLNTPRGALGIRMDVAQQANVRIPGRDVVDEDIPPGVKILEVIPGMPAERVLRVGDVITHIEGSLLKSSDDLIDLVQTRRPGDVITMQVQRPQRDENGRFINDAAGEAVTETLDLEITLGSVEGLHDPRIPTPPSRLDLERRRMLAAVVQRYGNKVQRLEVTR